MMKCIDAHTHTQTYIYIYMYIYIYIYACSLHMEIPYIHCIASKFLSTKVNCNGHDDHNK